MRALFFQENRPHLPSFQKFQFFFKIFFGLIRQTHYKLHNWVSMKFQVGIQIGRFGTDSVGVQQKQYEWN